MGISRYNSEGYSDPTSHAALSGIRKEEKAAKRALAGLGEMRELSVDFNEKLFHRLVDYATVHSDGRVVFTFRNGVEVSTEI